MWSGPAAGLINRENATSVTDRIRRMSHLLIPRRPYHEHLTAHYGDIDGIHSVSSSEHSRRGIIPPAKNVCPLSSSTQIVADSIDFSFTTHSLASVCMLPIREATVRDKTSFSKGIFREDLCKRLKSRLMKLMIGCIRR